MSAERVYFSAPDPPTRFPRSHATEVRSFRGFLRDYVCPWLDVERIPRERLAWCWVSMPPERRTVGAILMTVDWIRTQMAGRPIGRQLRDTY